MNGSKLREARKRFGYTQAQIGEMLGVTQQAVAKWERDIAEPRHSDLATLAKLYNTSVDSLLGLSTPKIVVDSRCFRTPRLASVACGQPIFAEDDLDDYVLQSVEPNADFCVIAKGDSMINARIFDGDTVFVRQQEMVDNGEIAVVAVDDTATIKRVYYYAEDARLVLMPENPAHSPLVYVRQELNHVRILGKVISFFSHV